LLRDSVRDGPFARDTLSDTRPDGTRTTTLVQAKGTVTVLGPDGTSEETPVGLSGGFPAAAIRLPGAGLGRRVSGPLPPVTPRLARQACPPARGLLSKGGVGAASAS
jgi:hypothetical protein